jgi:hypothetical protein
MTLRDFINKLNKIVEDYPEFLDYDFTLRFSEKVFNDKTFRKFPLNDFDFISKFVSIKNKESKEVCLDLGHISEDNMQRYPF